MVISSPNRNHGRQGHIPCLIVLHTTGGSFQSAINTIMNPSNNVSYHYVISGEGETVQAVAIVDTAWANGTSNTAGHNRNNQHSTLSIVREKRVNANLISVSIGFADMPQGKPTAPQLSAAIKLINLIHTLVLSVYGHAIPFDRDHIVGHHEISPRTSSGCPGRAFPFDALIADLNTSAPPAVPTVSLDILGDVKEIRGYIANGATFVRLLDIAEALGYTAAWDDDRRLPVISR